MTQVDRFNRTTGTRPFEVDRLDYANGARAFKDPCLVSTDANIVLYGLQTIKGQALVAGDRVLVKSQADQKENGIFVVAESNWRRASDFASVQQVTKGTLVPVADGEVYRVSSSVPVLIDESNIVFELSHYFVGEELVDAALTVFQGIYKDMLASQETATSAAASAGSSASSAESAADEAAASALSINPSNLVHIANPEIITGEKDFAVSPKVPTPVMPNDATPLGFFSGRLPSALRGTGFNKVRNPSGLYGLAGWTRFSSGTPITWSGEMTNGNVPRLRAVPNAAQLDMLYQDFSYAVATGAVFTISAECSIAARSSGSALVQVHQLNSSNGSIKVTTLTWTTEVGFTRKSASDTIISGCVAIRVQILTSGLQASAVQFRQIMFEPNASELSAFIDTAAMGPVLVDAYNTGFDWYRLYSDGWVDQGGRVQTGGSASTNLLWLVPMANILKVNASDAHNAALNDSSTLIPISSTQGTLRRALTTYATFWSIGGYKL